jgi:hypothetical protein
MIQEGDGLREARQRANGISRRRDASLIRFAASWLKSTPFL